MDIKKHWTELNLVKKVQERNNDKETFWLLDGPPYPNAAAHMGHVRGVTIKDMLIKMKAMQGQKVVIKPGFDTHGLPIENKVEKELGIKTKDEIEKMGVDKFMKRCRDFATSNIDEWMTFYKDMGLWFGWESPYMTLQKEYMNSIWWSVSELFNKGLIKEGTKPFYWCSHCQTVLSGYEVTDEYKELDDTSAFVKFPTKNGEFLLAWTTTPWTLPGNTALVVRGDAKYVKAKVDGDIVILAKKRLESLTRLEKKYEVLEEFEGKTLNGLEYNAVIDCDAQKSINNSKTARKVYLSKQVIKQIVAGKVAAKKAVKDETLVEHFTNLDDGSGIVHCAPGHGPADFELGKEYDFEVLSPVNKAGHFTDDVKIFQGKHVRKMNPIILEYLAKRGYLLGSEQIKHRYPVCWRCKTPLVFRLTAQWVLDVQKIKDKLLSAADKVEWFPEFAKERMMSWLSNAKDWTLSRQRYWNTPLPVWRCENAHVKVVSGSEELEKLSGEKVKDLHRDVVDSIHFKCDKCDKEMTRVEDVLDVWYDSGASTFAVHDYPKNNKMKELWPITQIDEGQDQIRGWFYTLLVLGVSLFDKAPYKKVTMHGWVVDKKGEKMSKSKGNFVTGRTALTELGSDVLRFFSLWEASPWEIMKYDPVRAKKEIGKMFFIWKNLHSYLLKFTKSELKESKLNIEDEWIMSKFNTLVKEFINDVENYYPHYATRKVFKFIVEDLSRKYMKLAKGRVRDGEQTPLWILKQIHFGLLKLIAPIAPDFTENRYSEFSEKFGGKDSVYFEDYPTVDENRINEDLETLFDRTFDIIERILAFRNDKGIGLKYPLRCVEIKGFKIEKVEEAIKTLTNVKKIDKCSGDEIKIDDVTIIIDSTQGPEELNEGYFREVSRRVRALRKKKGLDPHQEIALHLWGDKKLIDVVRVGEKEFKKRVGASELTFSEGGELIETCKIKTMELSLGI